MDDRFFDNFYNFSGFGPAISSQDVPESSLIKYRDHLPHKLLEYWVEHGWCGFGEGLLWVVNPEEYQPVVDAWLSGTPFEGRDTYHLIARSALGRLYIWGEESGVSIKINTPYAMLFPNDESDWMKEKGPDRVIQGFFASLKKDAVDLTDDNEKPLFERALQALGPLAPDEMYGFVPALALGGSNELKHLKKVKAIEHLVMLADLGERKIMEDIVKVAKSHGLL